MSDFEALLEEINSRKSRTGIITADRYFRDIEGCSGGLCPIDSFESWEKSLKESESKLTCTNSEMKVVKSSIKEMDADDEGILKFDAIITTPKRDRDGDVLETKGAELDMNMSLLWQHIPMNPIGKMSAVLNHTKDELKATFIIADTAMGRDAAALVKIGALRISHGFNPTEYEPMEDEKGWKFTKFEIFEVSLVSIPSNTDAVVTNFSGKSFESTMVKNWLKTKEISHRKQLLQEVNDNKGDPVDLGHSPEEIAFRKQEMERWASRKETSKECGCKSENNESTAVTDVQESTWTMGGDEISTWFKKSQEDREKELSDLKKSLTESKEEISDLEQQLLDMGMITPAKKSFEDIEREYIAELSKAPLDVVRKSHRRLSQIIRSGEDAEFDKTLQSVMD